MHDQNDSKDVTYLSFLDPKELASLRKKLEEERRAAKQKRSTSAPMAQEKGKTLQSHGATRKSSLRDITAGFGDPDGTTDHVATNADVVATLTKNVRIQTPNSSGAITYEDPNTTADASMLSTSSRRPRSKSFEEMTSAFILPDITLHKGAVSAIKHNKNNCTLCPSGDSSGPPEVPKPTAVTDRDIDATNATIRPSQSPSAALATVLKQLEDEVTHLKMQLATYERAYNAHDPALGRRKRQAVKSKIDSLFSEIEKRSEQIYALYDVLEGQRNEQSKGKKTVQDMNDGDVEETLQSLGIDTEQLAARAANVASKGKKNEKKGAAFSGARLEDLLAESDDELPYDGLSDGSDAESVELGMRRRRSIAA